MPCHVRYSAIDILSRNVNIKNGTFKDLLLRTYSPHQVVYHNYLSRVDCELYWYI